MINVLKGDLLKSKAQTLVNTVNCVGVMGKGIALEFKKRFPDMFKEYERKCQRNQIRLGKPDLYAPRKLFPEKDDRWVLNFPTKDHWRSVSRLEDIIKGIEYLKENYEKWGITSIAFPPLGCGHGGLEWGVVGPTLYRHLRDFNIPVELYAPYETPHEELQPTFLDSKACVVEHPEIANKIQPAWVALVAILNKIEKEPYHWPIGRTMFQKMAYFATEWKIPTGLVFVRSSYGPYSKDVKNIVTKLINNGLIEEHRHGRMFEVKVGKTFKDAYETFKFNIEKWEQAINQTADLFVRINTKQAEIATTVHFVAKSLSEKNESQTEMEIFEETTKWKQRRKPKLEDKEIASTIRNLNMLGWIRAKGSKELPLNDVVLAD